MGVPTLAPLSALASGYCSARGIKNLNDVLSGTSGSNAISLHIICFTFSHLAKAVVHSYATRANKGPESQSMRGPEPKSISTDFL